MAFLEKACRTHVSDIYVDYIFSEQNFGVSRLMRNGAIILFLVGSYRYFAEYELKMDSKYIKH